MRKLSNNGPQHNPKNTDRAAEQLEPNATPDSTPDQDATPEPKAARTNVTPFAPPQDAKSAAENGAAGTPDPFDPQRYRVRADGEPGSGVDVQPAKIPVRDKPSKTDWWWCFSEFTLRAHILQHEAGMDKEWHLVVPEVAALCDDDVREMDLHLCINRNSELFVLAIPAPDIDGSVNSWTESKRDAVNVAHSAWIRLKADKASKRWRYRTSRLPKEILPDPAPPDLTMRDMLERSFGLKHLINSYDHELLKVLRGEA